MKRSIVAAAVAAVSLLSGCASTGDIAAAFENRVTCTHARDAAWVVSRYWRLGIAAEVSRLDVTSLCQGANPAAATASAPAKPASAAR